jgi:hypothetical protein
MLDEKENERKIYKFCRLLKVDFVSEAVRLSVALIIILHVCKSGGGKINGRDSLIKKCETRGQPDEE